MQTTVKDIIDIMEENYPLYLAEDWDNCGLQIGNREQVVQTIAVALDPSPQIINQARQAHADLLITHHPLFFTPIKTIDFATVPGELIRVLGEAQITLYSAHTNLDCAERGINQHLAELMGLQNIRPLSSLRQDALLKLVVFVPSSHHEQVRQAICAAGAGSTGNYSLCSFRVKGTGTFKALEGAHPYVGSINQLEEVEEFRLETVFYKSMMVGIIRAMLDAHPYEEVAYDLYPLANGGGAISPGRVGDLVQPTDLETLIQQVKNSLSLDEVRVVGKLNNQIKKVAIVSGSGASFINQVINLGCDVLITGDLKYHEACAARDRGLTIIDAGHQGTEQVMVEIVSTVLRHAAVNRGLSCNVIGLFEENCIKSF